MANSHSLEIEIKSLLGSQEAADQLKAKLEASDPNLKLLDTNSQLNHYFTGNDVPTLFENVKNYLSAENMAKLENLANEGHDFSVRTRQINGQVRLVVKASIDSTTSSNGTARIEFEEPVEQLDLDQLDELVLQSGFEYQAKWSRDRQEYQYKDIHVCIDRNAGYGYLAEFEKIIDQPDLVETAKEEVRNLMNELGVEELTQDRLQRMFDFYNQNWAEFYGTDKTFVVK